MKKENSRTNYIVIALLVLVIGISIGYAALSATLNINGSSTIGKASWDVHFANIIETAGGVTATKAATITSGNATEVTYDVTLAKPGDYYEFEVDVEILVHYQQNLYSTNIRWSICCTRRIFELYS